MRVSRRFVTTGLLVVLCTKTVRLHAQASALALIEGLGRALESAGKGMVSIAEGFEALVRTATRGYDAAAARTLRSRLTDLVARSTSVGLAQTTLVISLEDYVERPEPRAWSGIVSRIDTLLNEVKSILDEVKAERSDFVLTEAYTQLAQTLDARVTILQQLRRSPAPVSPEELAALRSVAVRYRELIAARERATRAVAAYASTL